jgi:hypothetical protein
LAHEAQAAGGLPGSGLGKICWVSEKIRWVVERAIDWLQEQRRMLVRYDRLNDTGGPRRLLSNPAP